MNRFSSKKMYGKEVSSCVHVLSCVGQINLEMITEYATTIHTYVTTCIISYNSNNKSKRPYSTSFGNPKDP